MTRLLTALMFSALALGPPLRAGTIVNGDFADPSVINAQAIQAQGGLDKGWHTFFHKGEQHWHINDGVTSLNDVIGIAVGLGQIWSNDSENWFANTPQVPASGATAFTLGAGQHTLQITYQFSTAFADDNFELELWSYDYFPQVADSKFFRSPNNLFVMSRTLSPSSGNASNMRYQVNDLAKASLPPTDGWQTATVNFDLPADQEFIGIRLSSDLRTGGSLAVADIRIVDQPDVTIPEPARAASLLLAGLTLLGATRRRR